MTGNLFTIFVKVAGTLTADHTFFFSFPFGVTLVGANAKTDDSTSFLLNFGTPADADAYIDDATVTGAAATTVDVGAAGLVGAAPIYIAKDTELLLTVDYDGGSGGDAANVSVLLFFREG